MRRLALPLALTIALLGGCDLFGLGGDDPSPAGTGGGLPPVQTRSPAEDQPPIVWVGGVLQQIAENRLTLRDSASNPVALQRLAGGTTRFLVTADGAWRELSEDEVLEVEVGRQACAEALLDGTNLVALRVFLDAGCGPSGVVP